MKTKTGWLIVILISTVQLALLLVAVIMLFSWFVDQTEETVGIQACTDNMVISQQLIETIEDDFEDSLDAESVQPVLNQVHMPNYGFVCVLDAQTGNAIASNPNYLTLKNDQLANATFDRGPLVGIRLHDAAQQASSVTGSIVMEGRLHFVFARRILDGKYLLVAAQQQSQSFASVSDTIQSARKIAFAATLLVGLACMCLIVAILNRMTAKVDDHSQGLERRLTQREKQIVRTQNAVIFGLAKLAESRDNDTGEHLDRIRSYVMILSEDLRGHFDLIDEEFVNTIALASSLHDVGKVGIPDSILLKPGRLTREEREVMELHTLIGGECLEAIQNRLGADNIFMQIAKQIAYYHHERWDGKGYPHGLEGEDIPLVARIVAVADVYDALTSKRPYKQPLSHIESKGIILAGSGSQFDPEVVDAFLRHEEEFEAISRTQASLTDEEVLSDFHMLCERAQQSAAQEAETAQQDNA